MKWLQYIDIFFSFPENPLEKPHRARHHLFPVARDGVVLALHHLQGRVGAVCLQELFAAPHWHGAVAASVQQEDGPLVGGRRPVDVQLLRGQQVFTAQFHENQTADELWRVGGVEACVEELAGLARLLDDGAWGDEYDACGGFAISRQSSRRHRGDHPALRVSQEADSFHVGQAAHVVPDGARVGEFLLDGHILHPPLAIAVSVEIEADGGDARLGQLSRERRHRIDAFVGEDSVHQDHHRTMVCGRIEPFGQGDFVGEFAFRSFHGSFLC